MRNPTSFLAERRGAYASYRVVPMANRPKTPQRAGKTADGAPHVRPDWRHCALCGKNEAHALCTLFHDYFHDNPKLLPPGEEKLIVFDTGKRDQHGEPILGHMVANTCFQVWHTAGREKAWDGARARLRTRLIGRASSNTGVTGRGGEGTRAQQHHGGSF